MRHLIYDIGGGVPDGHTLKAVMMGGSSFPVMTPDDLDTPLDADSLGKKGYFIGSGVVTVIDERTASSSSHCGSRSSTCTSPAASARRAASARAGSSS